MNHAEQLRAITDICRYAYSRTAEVPTNCLGYRFAVCLVKLRDRHLCAFARIASRNAATDTVPYDSDERDPNLQSSHKPIPKGRENGRASGRGGAGKAGHASGGDL